MEAEIILLGRVLKRKDWFVRKAKKQAEEPKVLPPVEGKGGCLFSKHGCVAVGHGVF